MKERGNQRWRQQRTIYRRSREPEEGRGWRWCVYRSLNQWESGFWRGEKGVFIDTSGDRCISDRHNAAWSTGAGGGGCSVGQGVRIVCGQISLWRILLTNGKKILRSWTNSTKRSGKQNIIKWKSLQDALSKWPSQLYWQNAGKQLVEVLQMHTAFASTVQLFSYPIEFLICDIRGPRDGIEY